MTTAWKVFRFKETGTIDVIYPLDPYADGGINYSWQIYFNTEKYPGIILPEYTKEYRELEKLYLENKLDEALEIFAKYSPHTKNWPVKFINCSPLPTIRKII